MQPAPPKASNRPNPMAALLPPSSSPRPPRSFPCTSARTPTGCISRSDSYAGLMGDRNIWVCTRVTKNEKPASVMQPGGPWRGGGIPHTPTRCPPPLQRDITSKGLGNQQNPKTSSQGKMGGRLSGTHRISRDICKTCHSLLCDSV